MTMDNKRFFLEKNSAKHGNQYFIANEENNANISHKVEGEKNSAKKKVSNLTFRHNV
jgi:adenylate cyclase